jgi:hypothetical protein
VAALCERVVSNGAHGGGGPTEPWELGGGGGGEIKPLSKVMRKGNRHVGEQFCT